MQDLLTFVHANPRSKKENLATEVLAHLLSQSSGQRFLQSFLKKSALACEGTFIDPVPQERVDNCIPDIRLKVDKRTIAQLEIKFDAGLTASQSNGDYFKDAAVTTFFIAPKRRVDDLWRRLRPLNVGDRLDIITWDDFIEQMFEAVHSDDSGSKLFDGALQQFRSFCDVIDKEQFEPFSSQQLEAGPDYSSERHLVWLVEEMLAEAKRDGSIPETGKPRPGMDDALYFGQSSIVIGPCKLWVGYWPKAWKEHRSQGPIWVWVEGGNANGLNGLLQTLHPVGALRGEDGKIWVPLFPPTEQTCASQQDELNRLVKSFSTVLGLIQSAL